MRCRSAVDLAVRRRVRFRMACLTSLAVPVLVFAVVDPAAAASSPCASQLLQPASIHSTLHVQASGADWPQLISTTQITTSVGWPGTAGLLGDKRLQADSLRCFLPLGQEDYRKAPPVIKIDPAGAKQASVTITDTVAEVDNPDAGTQAWQMGPWEVERPVWGFKVAFWPDRLTPLGRQADWADQADWTVTLEASDLTVRWLSISPDASDGRGNYTWSSPPEQLPPTNIKADLGSEGQTRTALATQRPPLRWLSDVSWTIGDGILLYSITSWLAWRLWCRRLNDRERHLAMAVLSISLFGIICYIGYILDDFFWYQSNIPPYSSSNDIMWPNGNDIVWRGEGLGLVVVAVLFFAAACGTQWFKAAVIGILPAAAAISIVLDSAADDLLPHGPGQLVLLAVPLLLTVTFMGAGAAVWISRLWPFGKGGQQVGLRELRDTPFSGGRIVALMLAALVAGGLILGLGAVGSHDVWVHRHWWGLRDGSGIGAFRWVATDVLQETHWWIGGLQWILYFVIATGMFAALRALSTDSHGVFFGPRPTGDLAILTAVFGAWFVGPWGYYAGFSVPVPFIVAVAGLGGFALTKRLSQLDMGAEVGGRQANEVLGTDSVLLAYRDDLFAVADRAADAKLKKQDTATGTTNHGTETDGDNAAPANQVSAVVKEIPLSQEQLSRDRNRRWWNPPVLVLPSKVDAGVTALALGPGNTWWENGIIAVRTGALFAIIPAAFDIYTTWSTGNFSPLAYAFGSLDSLGMAASILIAWLTGLFTFGALLPYLRGTRTPVKGVIFGLIALISYTADAALRYALHMSPYGTFAIDGLMAVVLFATVGLLLDMRSLQNHDRDQSLIASVYRLGSMRVAVTYATTLLIVGLGIWQNVYLTNQTVQQRAQTTSSTAQTVNNTIGVKNSGK
jgi:hypothetical protein